MLLGGVQCERTLLYGRELRFFLPYRFARTSIEVEDNSSADKLALFDAVWFEESW